MKRKSFVGQFLAVFVLAGILVGLCYGIVKAADVEVILGTSSGFKIVRGTSVSAGTSAFFVGSSTVSIGTTTQAAMLTIAGSSTSGSEISLNVKNSSGADALFVRNDGAILIGTNTSNLNSALYVGSATSGSLGTITAGFLSMGTISANASLHGTTTVRFLADIFANGTVTASKFSGNGSSLTGITATSLGSTSNIDTTGTINAGSTTVSTFTTTGSITAGSAGGFKVDTAGSMTASTITSIGSVTASTLAITGNVFKVDSAGSMTATTITSTGSITVRSGGVFGTITAGFLSVGTITAETALHGTTTVGFLGGAKFGNTVHFNETNNGNSGAAKTIDWSASNKQRLTITQNTTLTFTNPGGPANLLLVLVQGSPGTGTVTWPGPGSSSSVMWPGGSAFTVSTATSAVDIVSCYFTGTNTYYCVGSSDFR